MDNVKKYQKILKEYGLSSNELIIYLSMIETGHTSILRISQTTEIRRSTVYATIELLIEKDLIKTVIIGKKKNYLPADPEILLEKLAKRKKEIEEIVPFLKKQYAQKSEKPVINFFEGKEAIRKIYYEALMSKEETLWYGSAKDMKEEFNDYYLIMTNIREHNPDFNGLRDIVNNTKTDKEYARVQNGHNDPKIKVKMLKSDLLFLNTDNIIYNNKLVLLSIKKDFFAIVIESPDVVMAYRTMFELAYRAADIVK